MDNSCLIDEIKKKDIDIEYYAKLIIDNEEVRKDVIKNLLSNKEIMVYYHCYYIVTRASEINPQLFYEYWDDFKSLLAHKNSYHRDIGMTLIANLVVVDVNKKFDIIYDDYMTHINDEKFMTAQCCIKNIKKIVKPRHDLINKIVDQLLRIDDITSYSDKQRELLKYDILDLFDLVYGKVDDKGIINNFVIECLNSISPKTKKMSKKMKSKYLL